MSGPQRVVSILVQVEEGGSEAMEEKVRERVDGEAAKSDRIPQA
jgi:hypothetical protein